MRGQYLATGCCHGDQIAVEHGSIAFDVGGRFEICTHPGFEAVFRNGVHSRDRAVVCREAAHTWPAGCAKLSRNHESANVARRLYWRRPSRLFPKIGRAVESRRPCERQAVSSGRRRMAHSSQRTLGCTGWRTSRQVASRGVQSAPKRHHRIDAALDALTGRGSLGLPTRRRVELAQGVLVKLSVDG